MSPECLVICIDNSEWMRNGDYNPTRYHALYDAVNTLIQAKSRDNVETTFSVLSLTGFQLLCSPTSDQSKVMQRIHSSPLKGSVQLLKALKISELVLEQRQNKHAAKRVVAFIGSPFSIEIDDLMSLAFRFQQNSVSVDIIAFGGENSNSIPSIQNFIELLNDVSTSEGSKNNLLVVPPGESLVRAIRTSEIMPNSQRANPQMDDLEIDAEMDPDLAEAIRLSLQDQRPGAPANEEESNTPAATTTVEDGTTWDANFDAMTEQEQIDFVLKLSLQDAQKDQSNNDTKKK